MWWFMIPNLPLSCPGLDFVTRPWLPDLLVWDTQWQLSDSGSWIFKLVYMTWHDRTCPDLSWWVVPTEHFSFPSDHLDNCGCYRYGLSPEGIKGIYKSLLSMLAETTHHVWLSHSCTLEPWTLNHHDSSDPAAALSDTGVVGMLSHDGRYQQPRDGLTWHW